MILTKFKLFCLWWIHTSVRRVWNPIGKTSRHHRRSVQAVLFGSGEHGLHKRRQLWQLGHLSAWEWGLKWVSKMSRIRHVNMGHSWALLQKKYNWLRAGRGISEEIHVAGAWGLLVKWEDMRLKICTETVSWGGWPKPGLILGVISGGEATEGLHKWLNPIPIMATEWRVDFTLRGGDGGRPGKVDTWVS